MPEARRQPIRPVLSPDRTAIASISPVREIIRVDVRSDFSDRSTTRIHLPKGLRDWLPKVEILRWGLSRLNTAALVYEDGPDHAVQPEALLLSDGSRLVVIDCPVPPIGTKQHEDGSVQARIRADFDLGTQHGKIAFADFVLDSQHVLILFETSTHASILALDKPHADQIASPKYNDSRCFATSPDGRCLALLIRSNGQDLISMSTAPQDSPVQTLTFAIRTADAQGINWSPNGDPVLAIVDAATYGTKVLFYTATGQALNRLQISSLTTEPTVDLGISSLKWLPSEADTIIAATDGEMNMLARQQNNSKLSTIPLFAFKQPDVIDGPNAHVFQEIVDTLGERYWSRFDTMLASNVSEPTTATAEILAIDSDASLLCTKVSTHPKVAWLWPRAAAEPPTILIFSDNVKQALIHPVMQGTLVILTAQSTKAGSEQYYRMYACHPSRAPEEILAPLSQHRPDLPLSRVEGHWITTGHQRISTQLGGGGEDKPQPFLLTWPGHFEAGLIHTREDGKLFWTTMPEAQSAAQSDPSLDPPHLMMQMGDEDDALFDTPSKPPRRGRNVR